MKLRLVKQGDFLGTKCDFYVNEANEIFMSRTQIGYALKYKNPSKGIEDIHNRHHERLDSISIKVDPLSLQGSNPHYRNGEKAYMYPEKGVYEICRYSRQKVASDFYDWVYDVIQSIKQNGYYIASEKDEAWLGTRQDTKAVRKVETDQIKLFVEYAKSQGSRNADRYYVLLTNLVNRRLDIDPGGRDCTDQKTLMRLKSLETVVELHLATLMAEQLPYKEIYQGIKRFMEVL